MSWSREETIVKMEHYGFARDGAIVQFPNSTRYFMKVTRRYDGTSGVVDILTGEYIPNCDLEKYGLGFKVKVLEEDIVTLFLPSAI